MPDASLGLIMILKDEEQNLERSLGPLASLFDEVVAVDTGSSDATVEICTRLGRGGASL
jgi:glycosyltransferase involved in cell wall biosynthesis